MTTWQKNTIEVTWKTNETLDGIKKRKIIEAYEDDAYDYLITLDNPEEKDMWKKSTTFWMVNKKTGEVRKGQQLDFYVYAVDYCKKVKM